MTEQIIADAVAAGHGKAPAVERCEIIADAVAAARGKTPAAVLKIAREAGAAVERREILDGLSRWPHELHHVKHLDEYGADDRTPADIDDANVYTSLITDGPYEGDHTIVLDLDVPARLVPSTTPGHSHLFIDLPMSWPAYERLLKTLARVGVIEDGYYSASSERAHTAVRLPWIKKETPANG